MENKFVVYILRSEKSPKRYTGFTSDLISRFKSHNERSNKGWTINHRPWKVAHIEFFDNKEEAIKREKFLKSGVGTLSFQWSFTQIANCFINKIA